MTSAPTHRADGGSASIELAIQATAWLALVATAFIAGRVGLARQSIEAAAFDAARTASLARSAATAQHEATKAAMSTLDAQGLSCTSLTVTVNTDGFAIPVGQPATVTATLRCRASFSDVALPGMPGAATLTASFTSPLDTYRARIGGSDALAAGGG